MHEPVAAFSCDDISPKTNAYKLREFLRVADRSDVKVTFFVVPKSTAGWNSSKNLVAVLKDAQSCGHEVGLHGLGHFPFETGNPFDLLNLCYNSVKDKVGRGTRILNETLEINPKGFRAPYNHCNRSLFHALNDLNFLYDSSTISWSNVLFSYFPPLRAIWVHRKKGLTVSMKFHPFNLKLWEIPIAQEFSWHNLGFEVNAFDTLFQNAVGKLTTGCLAVSSHIGALSMSGMAILKRFFSSIRNTGLRSVTLKEVAEEDTASELAKAYCV